MKKIFYVIAVTFSFLATEAANALPIGVYWGLKGGMSVQKDDDKHNDDGKIENESGNYFVSADVGVRLLRLRGELEYTFRPDTTDVKSIIFGDDSVLAQNIMANIYYDLVELPFINLYVNAGIGNTKFSGASALETDNNFTWAAGLGVNLSLLNIANLDVGYRYMSMGDIKFSDGRELAKDSHDIYLGLRFGF